MEDVEEKRYNAGSDRGPIRPSMVVMTSKLLNVTEGMAAMNMRIAFGVFLCILLLVATFIVNVVAFDYAKDNKVQQPGDYPSLKGDTSKMKALVDKESGKVLATQNIDLREATPMPEALTVDFLLRFDKVETEGVSSRVQSHVSGPCPETVPQSMKDEYCSGSRTYLALAPNDIVFFFTQEAVGGAIAAGLMSPGHRDEFVAAALEATKEEVRSRRHLLHVQQISECCDLTGHCGLRSVAHTHGSVSHTSPSPSPPPPRPSPPPPSPPPPRPPPASGSGGMDYLNQYAG